MELHLNMESDTVRETAEEELVCIAPDTSVRDVLRLLKDSNTGSALVLQGGKLAGIYTERDALRLMANGESLDIPISQVMVGEPVTVRECDSVAAAVRKMSQGGYRRLPIVDSAGQPIGAVKASGILRYLVEHFPQSIYNLPPAPDNASKEREGA